MMTKNEIAAWVVTAMNTSLATKDIGDDETWPIKVRAYSGRGMYGKECPSICVNYESEALSVMFDVVIEAARSLSAEDAETVRWALAAVSSDSMGRGRVYYWRGLSTGNDNQ